MRTRVHFFTVALKNGHVMSRPKYTSDHAILGDVIQEVEKSAPEAAWVQILFARRDVTRDAVGLKNSMSHAKKDIETPKIDFMSGEERERAELHGDFYRRSDERIKKLDEITSLPTVLMAIQGMWVGEKEQLRDLPFSQCADEVDSLKMFTFHDPRMLIDLVERRMVTDIGRYIAGYTGSRLEPPSFLITVDELPYYANLPWGRYVRAIKSVPVWAAYSPYAERGYVQGEVDPSAWKSTSRVVRFDPPEMDDKLDEEEGRRIELLASNSVRGIEIVYQEQKTEILLSAESPTDATRYWRTFKSIYGELDPEPVEDARPKFLAAIPAAVGLSGPRR